MIQVGDSMPQGILKTMTPDGLVEVDTLDLFTQKRVVLFGVPGAFTPGCSRTHLPGYVEHAEAIKAKGFDTIGCIAVNDAWVMHAWGESADAIGTVLMLADGSAHYVSALGLHLDLSHVGMGMRCKRFSIVVQNGIVESVNIDARVIDLTAAQNTCGV